MKTKVLGGNIAFLISGLCAMSSGVVVSLLQEYYGFAYAMTGTLLALMNIGNLVSSFASGVLPGKIGTKRSALILSTGYALGYFIMTLGNMIKIPDGFNIVWILMAAFALLGIAKGCAINNCTVLVGNNSASKTKGMNIMHACYACGALLGPIIISIFLLVGEFAPIYALAICGLFIWIVFFCTPMEEEKKSTKSNELSDWSFMKSGKFWMLTALIFCQNAAETSVTGWMVTYYKGSGILSGTVSNYTITIMWGATLIARLLIAFVFPIKNKFKALSVMGFFCIILYGLMIFSDTGMLAIVLLFLFSFSMAGINPTAVAGAGSMMNQKSMGVMLPTAGIGAILMPWIIGIVAENVSLKAGMICNIVPCVGILILSMIIMKSERQAI